MDARTVGLGKFALLPDELITRIIVETGDIHTLAALSLTSKVFRIFCLEEPIWMHLCISAASGDFVYEGNWRNTALKRGSKTALGAPAQVSAPAGFSSLFLYSRWYRCHMDITGFVPNKEQVLRASALEMTPQTFSSLYESKNLPVMLVDALKNWKASKWTWQSFKNNFGQVELKVSKPQAGSVTMRISNFVEYAACQHDETPLYVFDGDFGTACPTFLKEYEVPAVFREDLFACLGRRRPDYRWLVAGPARSGAPWHLDPNLTSAWNALLVGRKRWALYPPDRVPPGVVVYQEDGGEIGFDSPPSLTWFLEVLPNLPEDERPIEVVQNAGETIFVPSGWWHCVLNLEDTIAITQNFVSGSNFESVVEYMASGARHGTLASLLNPEEATELDTNCGNGQAGGSSPVGEGAPCRCGGQGEEGSSGGLDDLSGGASVVVAGRAGRCQCLGGAGKRKRCEGEAGEEAAARNVRREREERPITESPQEEDVPVGFQQTRRLGPWLRELWSQQPPLRPRVLAAAEAWCQLDMWRRRLGCVLAALGLPAAEPHELFPVNGEDTLVFVLAGAVVKFCVQQPRELALIKWQMEAYALRACGADPSLSRACPRLLGQGIQQDTLAQPSSGSSPGASGCSWEEAPASAGLVIGLGAGSEGSSGGLPVLVVARCEGATLGELGAGASGPADIVGVAEALGQLLPRLHALPLPQTGHLQPTADSGVPKIQSEESQASTMWCGGDDQVWSSTHGSLTKARSQMPDDPARSLSSCAAGWAGNDGASLWGPFIAFLRHSRSSVVGRMRGELPPHLHAQLDAYLPADPAVLLGFTGTGVPEATALGTANTATKPGLIGVEQAEGHEHADGAPACAVGLWQPSLLHGDLSPENILVGRADGVGLPKVQLVDFGDSGHGDPLYEVVTLHATSFRSEPALLATFLGSYTAAASRESVAALRWASVDRGSARLSKVAMSYMLLHDQDLVARAFTARPDLARLPNLEAIEDAIWAQLATLPLIKN